VDECAVELADLAPEAMTEQLVGDGKVLLGAATGERPTSEPAPDSIEHYLQEIGCALGFCRITNGA
jgi:hypothetical protein